MVPYDLIIILDIYSYQLAQDFPTSWAEHVKICIDI